MFDDLVANSNTPVVLVKPELVNPTLVSTRAALNALEWVRKEIVRLKAPDQFRLGIREQSVQRLCARLLRDNAPANRR